MDHLLYDSQSVVKRSNTDNEYAQFNVSIKCRLKNGPVSQMDGQFANAKIGWVENDSATSARNESEMSAAAVNEFAIETFMRCWSWH